MNKQAYFKFMGLQKKAAQPMFTTLPRSWDQLDEIRDKLKDDYDALHSRTLDAIRQGQEDAVPPAGVYPEIPYWYGQQVVPDAEARRKGGWDLWHKWEKIFKRLPGDQPIYHRKKRLNYPIIPFGRYARNFYDRKALAALARQQMRHLNTANRIVYHNYLKGIQAQHKEYAKFLQRPQQMARMMMPKTAPVYYNPQDEQIAAQAELDDRNLAELRNSMPDDHQNMTAVQNTTAKGNSSTPPPSNQNNSEPSTTKPPVPNAQNQQKGTQGNATSQSPATAPLVGGPRIPDMKSARDFMQYMEDLKNPWSIGQKYFMTPSLRNQMTNSMRQGIPHLLTASRLANGGSLTPNQIRPVLQNFATKSAYQNQGFWHRLWEWIKQKWARVTGDQDYLRTGQRPVAMRAKRGWQNAQRNLQLLSGEK